jgi:competence protein ComEC
MRSRERLIIRWFRDRPRIVVLTLLVALDLGLLAGLTANSPGVLRVSFLDVGQGDAVLIESPVGVRMLYDAGPPSGAVLRGLGDALPFWERRVDAIVLSHPDSDHAGGIPDVLATYENDLILENGAKGESGAYAAALDAMREEGARVIMAGQGTEIDLGGGVTATVLTPIADRGEGESNDGSLALRVTYGATAFLLTGDLPSSLERMLVREYGESLQSDVLKLGHHGSRSSSDPVFLAAVGPRFAVVSAGTENRYGHPSPEVVARARESGAEVFSTSEEGAIVFVSDGQTVIRR